MATAFEALKSLCEDCSSTETDIACGNGYFVGRRLNHVQSTVARRLQALSSEAFSSGMFSLVDGSLEGATVERRDLDEAVVKGRSNGVLSYLDCARDPQAFSGRRSKRTVRTEMLYIHRDVCPRQQIGADTMNTGRYFSDSSLLQDISRNTGLVDDLILYDSMAMVKAIDGHSFMGNWGGANSDSAANLAGAHIQRWSNLDGVVKQILLQKDNMFYSTVLVTIPTIVGGDAIFLEYKGKVIGSDTTVVGAVTRINELTEDVTGDKLFSASIIGTTQIRIVSDKPTRPAYGLQGLQLRYSLTAEYGQCTGAITPVVEENNMPFDETPFTKSYDLTITKDNFYDYWVDVVCDLQRHVAERENALDSELAGNNNWIVALDPMIYNMLPFSDLKEIALKENAELFIGKAGKLFPKFVPVRSMLSTGGWVATTPGNFELHTNTAAQLNNIETWYDPNCRLIKSDNEMIMGVLVNDFANTATNLCNSAFHTSASAAPIYEPINIPHMCPDVRTDCCNTVLDPSDQVLKASANVSYEAAADWDYSLTSTSTSSASDLIVGASTAWEIHFTDGTTSALTGTTDNAVVSLTDAQHEMVAYVKITVTTAGAATDVAFVAVREFTETI